MTVSSINVDPSLAEMRTRDASNLCLHFSRRHLEKRKDERVNESPTFVVKRWWSRGEKENKLGERERERGREITEWREGGGEKFARTFFGVLSRRRPRSLDTREQPPFVVHSSTICRALRIHIYRSLRQSDDLKFWANTTPASTTTDARSSFSRFLLAAFSI